MNLKNFGALKLVAENAQADKVTCPAPQLGA